MFNLKKIISLLLFLGVFVSQSAFAQPKIGYTNPARILNELPEVAEVDQEIQQLIEQRDQQLAQRATSLQKTFSDYEAVMSNLSDQERQSREQELMQLNQEFEQERQGMMNEVQQKRAELMQPIIERMNNAMAEVAEELDLDLVLNEGTSYGDAIIFYSNSNELDITEKILEKLK